MRALCCVAAAMLVVGVAGISALAQDENELMSEVAEIGDTMAQAMIDNDTETMFSLYAEDAISLPNMSPRLDGIEAMRQSNEMMTAAGMKILSFDSSPTDVWQAGDQVIEIGTYVISLQVPGVPSPIDDKGKYLTIYVRDDDGSLKVKVETWNTDMNPMAMASQGPAE